MLTSACMTTLRRQACAVLMGAICLTLANSSPHVANASELRRNAVVRAVQQARDSIVNIHGQKTIGGTPDELGHAEAARRVNGMGTGIVVDQRGYIITNHHVVQGVRRIQVTLSDNTQHFARLVSFDPITDLAVIKVDAQRQLPVIKMGISSDLMEGEEVIAIGNAYGYENTVTRGIVSALHRTVQVSDTQQYEDLIQTDASINPGNSGGPLMNIDGEMIGVNVAVRAGAQGIGFAIPIDRVLKVVAELMSTRQVDNTWHGLETTDDAATGVLISKVESDSPAAKGGFHPGDIILRVGNRSLTRPLDLERALIERQPGEEVEVSVRRDKQPVELSFILASLPTRKNTPEEKSWDVLGLRVRSLSPEKFHQINTRYRGGLVVTDVRTGSPAEEQGIRAGDVLVGMHIWETVSMENLAYVLNRPDLDDLEPLKFYIVRGQETLFGHITVASRAK
jgi:serine protease Do